MISSHEMISNSKGASEQETTQGTLPPCAVPYGYQGYYGYPSTPEFQHSPPLEPTFPYVYVPYSVPQYSDNHVANHSGHNSGQNMSPSLSGTSSTPSSPQIHPLSPGTVRSVRVRRYPRQSRPHYTTNVYIHGLPPNTTDEALYNMCSGYGIIISSKSIIDPKTQTCRGYGFVMYEHLHQAQHAIYCLGIAGFEASFAKVRSPQFVPEFRHQVTHAKLQDQSSSNLYLTNLPLDYTEQKLEELFAPYQVHSVRIMRDQQQQSRGVGFARMPDRQSAQAALEALDGAKLGPEPLKIKFADAPTSKRARNFSHLPLPNHVQGQNVSDEHGYNYGYPPHYALGYAYPPYVGFPGGFYPGMAYYPNPMGNMTGMTPDGAYPDVDELADMVQNHVNISSSRPEVSTDSPDLELDIPRDESHPASVPSLQTQDTFTKSSEVPVV